MGHEHDEHDGKKRFDWLLWISGALIAVGYLAYLIFSESLMDIPYVGTFAHTMWEVINITWWSLILGVFLVGLLGIIPRELIMGVLGPGGTFKGIFRATLGGVLLDICSHGILMVGMRLYERGASVGQTMAFLIASPWNSISLTLILIAMIGWKFTLLFILFSVVIAIISGMIFEWLVRRGTLPKNPYTPDIPKDFRFIPAFKAAFAHKRPSWAGLKHLLMDGLQESKLVFRWIFFGFVLAGLIRAFVPLDTFQQLFGPTISGLFLTLLFATILEVCSEGSTPIAADLVTRASAPGNAFTFLMAGVSTDYTEILSLRERTKSWKVALFLPLITLPQIVFLGWVLNRGLT